MQYFSTVAKNKNKKWKGQYSQQGQVQIIGDFPFYVTQEKDNGLK